MSWASKPIAFDALHEMRRFITALQNPAAGFRPDPNKPKLNPQPHIIIIITWRYSPT
jgi:hypothetical protein